MLTKPPTRLPPIRDGITSRYVSVVLSSTLIAFSPFSTAANRFGRSIYASGPATRSTPYSLISVSRTRSAIQPITPTIGLRPAWRRRKDAKYCRRESTFCSALSRIEHVLSSTASASSGVPHWPYPSISIIDATTSLSATFIWQP